MADLRHERGDDAIHAADRFQHHRGLIVQFAEAHQVDEARAEQPVGIQRLFECWRTRVVVRGVAGARGADVLEAAVELAKLPQVFEQLLIVAAVERGAEALRSHCLGEQFSDEASRVRDVFAIAQRAAAEHRVVLHPGVAVLVDEQAPVIRQAPCSSPVNSHGGPECERGRR